MAKYKSVSLDIYTHGLLQRVGKHMTGGKILDTKAKSIPEVITILAESYHINNIVIPKQWEKEMKNEI